MESSSPEQTHPKNWPPQRGLPLFLAWMVGCIVIQVFQSILPFAFAGSSAPSQFNAFRFVATFFAVLLHGWQAWLLFLKYPSRFFLWTLLPLVGLAVPYNPKAYGYMSLAFPIVEAAILRGIRIRAWAWILAGMAGVVATEAFYWLMYPNGYQTITGLIEKAFGSAPNAPLVAMAASGISKGAWLLTEAISAAVLAWKMPPAAPSESPASN